ncbi:hypothetical protein Bbelb_108640 [Branchiostoma belcheri]|nr:hypothetical protein Bbelb_108640 [Branchiostoma belcheri]
MPGSREERRSNRAAVYLALLHSCHSNGISTARCMALDENRAWGKSTFLDIWRLSRNMPDPNPNPFRHVELDRHGSGHSDSCETPNVRFSARCQTLAGAMRGDYTDIHAWGKSTFLDTQRLPRTVPDQYLYLYLPVYPAISTVITIRIKLLLASVYTTSLWFTGSHGHVKAEQPCLIMVLDTALFWIRVDCLESCLRLVLEAAHVGANLAFIQQALRFTGSHGRANSDSFVRCGYRCQQSWQVFARPWLPVNALAVNQNYQAMEWNRRRHVTCECCPGREPELPGDGVEPQTTCNLLRGAHLYLSLTTANLSQARVKQKVKQLPGDGVEPQTTCNLLRGTEDGAKPRTLSADLQAGSMWQGDFMLAACIHEGRTMVTGGQHKVPLPHRTCLEMELALAVNQTYQVMEWVTTCNLLRGAHLYLSLTAANLSQARVKEKMRLVQGPDRSGGVKSVLRLCHCWCRLQSPRDSPVLGECPTRNCPASRSLVEATSPRQALVRRVRREWKAIVAASSTDGNA